MWLWYPSQWTDMIFDTYSSLAMGGHMVPLSVVAYGYQYLPKHNKTQHSPGMSFYDISIGFDFWFLRFCGIHLRAFSEGVPKLLLNNLTIILFKLLPYLPGENKFKICNLIFSNMTSVDRWYSLIFWYLWLHTLPAYHKHTAVYIHCNRKHHASYKCPKWVTKGFCLHCLVFYLYSIYQEL